MSFHFKNIEKDIIQTGKDKKGFKSNNICRLCEKEIDSDKVRDHCHLTGTYRGPAHSVWNTNVTQKRSNIAPFIIHNFRNYDCHLIFKQLVDMKKDEVKFKILPK